MNRRHPQLNTRNLTLLALLFALSIVVGLFENLIPPPPLPIPVRYGLANIVVMFALFTLGFRPAVLLVVLRSFSVLLFRGSVAAGLSLAGGLASVSLMALFASFSAQHLSYLLLSVIGAVAHNLSQLAVYIFLYRSVIGDSWTFLLIPLSLFGMAAGTLSGLIYRFLQPSLAQLGALPFKRDAARQVDADAAGAKAAASRQPSGQTEEKP